jgi:RND family efflux transporter MFP subunit
MKKLAIIVFAVLALGACKKQEKKAESLPPAAGEGAKPLPEIPDLKHADAGAGSGSSAGTPTSSVVSGTLQAREEVKVGPKSSGTITQINVDENSKVKKGDVLFRLDTGDLALRRQQAAVALDAARVNLKAVQVEYDRTKAMLAENAVNRAAWDQVEARHDAAAVGVRQAEVTLAIAQKALSDASVRSPLDGVVTAKLKNAGETATMMPPTVVIAVQDQSVLELRFRLTERSLMKMKPGAKVRARFEAVGLTRDALVVRTSPTVDVRTRTFEVVAQIDNRDGALRPGLLADVELSGAAPPDGGSP